MGLTNKQQAFVNEYTRDFCATQAAIRAGYSGKTAYSLGQRLLKNAEISDAIRQRIEEKTMGADEVLTRLADMARSDMADLMAITTSGFTIELTTKNESGEIIANPKTKLIKKIKQKVTTYLAKSEDGEDREVIETELELYDAQAALVQIGKHLKLFSDPAQVSMNLDLSSLTTEQLEAIANGDDPIAVVLTGKS